MNALWIILAGSLVAIPCGILGTYLALRKMTMLGDAISHAVLPGIVLGFLVSHDQQSVFTLLSAGLVGMLTTVLIEFIHQKAKLQSDAAIGITFTLLFAIGVILISLFAGDVDLDLDCVLFGEIAYVPLDLWLTEDGISFGPRSVWMLGGVTVAVLLLVILGYKELQITTFDPAFAATIGINPTLWHYLLMSAVSLTAVVAFEVVGAILVIALLAIPAAIGSQLSNRLLPVLIFSSGLGIMATCGGYFLAVGLNSSISGAIAVVAGLILFVILLLKKLKTDKKKPIIPISHANQPTP